MTWGDEGGARHDDENSFELLAPLVAAATVRIHPPSTGYAEGEPVPPPWGSGFFVAPEWVLTCAHVALSGGGAQGGRREVGLTFRGVDRPVAGRVEWARPDGPTWDSVWPAPDLALIRLQAPPPPPPEGPGCVWLSERTARLFTRDEVAFFGASEIAGEVVDISGRCTVKGELGSEGLLRLGNEDELLEGVSGGPLVDLVRGEVIGVIKGRRTGRDGGLATSVIQLRRLPAPAGPVLGLGDDLYQAVVHGHDLYHAERHLGADSGESTWTDAQNQLPSPPGALTPGQRTKLLGLLAALPPPVSTPRLDALVGELRGRPYEGALPAPRGWRDGLGLLHELRGEFAGLEAVLRYALHAATDERPYPAPPGAEKRLLEWVHSVAEDAPSLPRRVRTRLRLEEQARLARADHWPAVFQPWDVHQLLAAAPVVRLDSLAVLELDSRFWEENGYDWRVCARPRGRNDPIDGASEVGDLRRPPARLLAALVEAFRRGDEPGSPVPLQVAVPYSLLQIPFDQWRLTPDGPTLGEVRPVVVRCTDPAPGAEDGEELAALRRARWAAAHQEQLVADVLDCDGGLPRALPERAALLGRELATVPVLCRTPSAGGEPAALHRVMASGYNVILWQRELAAREPSCDQLHDWLALLVGGGPCGRLLENLWRMREAAGAAHSGLPSASWMSDLALLYGEPEGETSEEDFLEAP